MKALKIDFGLQCALSKEIKFLKAYWDECLLKCASHFAPPATGGAQETHEKAESRWGDSGLAGAQTLFKGQGLEEKETGVSPKLF